MSPLKTVFFLIKNTFIYSLKKSWVYSLKCKFSNFKVSPACFFLRRLFSFSDHKSFTVVWAFNLFSAVKKSRQDGQSIFCSTAINDTPGSHNLCISHHVILAGRPSGHSNSYKLGRMQAAGHVFRAPMTLRFFSSPPHLFQADDPLQFSVEDPHKGWFLYVRGFRGTKQFCSASTSTGPENLLQVDFQTFLPSFIYYFYTSCMTNSRNVHIYVFKTCGGKFSFPLDGVFFSSHFRNVFSFKYSMLMLNPDH